jgi:hypothetical protein
VACASALIFIGAGITRADFTFGEPTNLGSTVNRSTWQYDVCVSTDGLLLLFGTGYPNGENYGCAAFFGLESTKSTTLIPFCSSHVFQAQQASLVTLNITVGSDLRQYKFNFKVQNE